MDILLFGISNVGKTTMGRILADKLGYDFYDLDEEIRGKYKVTMQEFVDTYWLRNTRDTIRGELIGEILQREGDKVVAVSPMHNSRYFIEYLKKGQVIAIELQDTAENVFERLVFTDEKDQICEDSVEYREAHKDYYIRDIEEDIIYYKEPFEKISRKFQINNDSPDKAVNRLIEQYKLD